MEELERRLGVIGIEIGRMTFSAGSNFDEFNFNVTCKENSLLFEHDPLRVEVGGFKLLDAKKWDADEKHQHYPAVHRSGVGLLWYQADVSWAADGKKGHASNISLGHPLDWDKALAGLPPGNAEREVIEALLMRIEKLASGIFGSDLLEKQPPGRERQFSSDHVRERW
jgi:hypothetical protein